MPHCTYTVFRSRGWKEFRFCPLSSCMGSSGWISCSILDLLSDLRNVPPSKITRKQEWKKIQVFYPFYQSQLLHYSPRHSNAKNSIRLKFFVWDRSRPSQQWIWKLKAPHTGIEITHVTSLYIGVHECPRFSVSLWLIFFPINFYHFSLNNWATPQLPSVSCFLKCVA